MCILGVFYAILSEYNKEVLDKWLKNRASQESADNICILKNLTESMFLEGFVSCRCNSERTPNSWAFKCKTAKRPTLSNEEVSKGESVIIRKD